MNQYKLRPLRNIERDITKIVYFRFPVNLSHGYYILLFGKLELLNPDYYTNENITPQGIVMVKYTGESTPRNFLIIFHTMR